MAGAAHILVVEDDNSAREVLGVLLRRSDYVVTLAEDGQRGCDLLKEQEYDLLITDLKMPGVSGLQVLAAAKLMHPQIEVIIVTAYATTETAIVAMKQGAYDYITKPYKVDEILVTVERALEKRALVQENVTLREELRDRFRLDRMVGRSPVMQRLFSMIRQVAATRSSVLITGDSGTGKELVARAIHHLGDRADKPFIPVNCAAIPDALMESQLFGHRKGAFTGAVRHTEGLIAAGDRGTVFLDEVAELDPSLQVKLLRTLQERTIMPVGATDERGVDVRFIAATNRDIKQEVARGAFREDLFYRLHVIPIHVPPLRERDEDIPLLAEHFARKFAAEMGRKVRGFTPRAMALLCKHDYPGNVRELENIVERGMVLATESSIGAEALPDLQSAAPQGDSLSTEIPADGLDLDDFIGEIEQRVLQQALERTGGNRTEAAALLRISLRSIRYRLAKFGINGS